VLGITYACGFSTVDKPVRTGRFQGRLLAIRASSLRAVIGAGPAYQVRRTERPNQAQGHICENEHLCSVMLILPGFFCTYSV